jgi:MFS family permease
LVDSPDIGIGRGVQEETVPNKPGVGELLAARAFMRLWIVGGFSNAMRQFEGLVAALFTLQVTHSGFAVAAVSAARMMPMLLVGALAGVVAEAMSRKAILVGGLVINAVTSGTLALLALTGHAHPWQVAIGALISGTMWSTENPCRRRMVGESVEGALVPRAMALDSVTNSLTRMGGPLLAGLVFQFTGLAVCYAFSAVCYVMGAMLAFGINYRQVTHRFAMARVPEELSEALAFARTHAVIAGVLGVTMAMNFFGFSYTALVAPIGQQHFHVSAALVGVLAAAEPCGALLGGLFLTSGDPPVTGRVLMVGGTLLFMMTVIVMPVSPWFAFACGALWIGGFGTAAFSNMQSSLIILHAPAAICSRMMGLLTVCIGAGPLGLLVIGALAAWLGNVVALQLMGMAGLLLVGYIGLAWRRSERRQIPALRLQVRTAGD